MNNVLIYAEVPSHPQQHGNSKRIYNLSKVFKSMGCSIHYVYFRIHSGLQADYDGMGAAWDSLTVINKKVRFKKTGGDTYRIDDTYQPGLGEQIFSLCQRYQVSVVICNYIFQSKILEYLPEDILKIIDTHDKFTDRHILLKANGIPDKMCGYSYSSIEEAKGLNRADKVLAIQKEEADFFGQICDKEIILLPHLESQQFVDKQYNKVEKIGFIGSDNPVNEKAVLSFLEQYIPYATAKGMLAKVYFAGLICNKITINSQYIKKLGVLDDINAFYASMDLVINPLIFGTGLKIKTVEALAYGLPIISTNIGFEGIESNHPYHHCADIEEMLNVINEIYNCPGEKLNSLSLHSRMIFSRYESNVNSIVEGIISIIKNTEAADYTNTSKNQLNNVSNKIETVNGVLKLIGKSIEFIKKIF